MSRPITTTISEEFYTFCKENNISWKQAISTGVRALMDGKNVQKELSEYQDKVARMSRTIEETNQRLWDLERKK